jgi:hypothetical protein
MRRRLPRGHGAALAVVLATIVLGTGALPFFPGLAGVATAAAAESKVSDSTTQKQPLRGLIDMGVQSAYTLDIPFPTVNTAAITPYAGAFGGIVINEGWAQLEPSPGHEQWRDLDTSLAAVTAWNMAHPSTPLGVKLRIFGGNTAPAWAKALGGAPLTIVTKGISKTFGRWWTEPYAHAWSSFQHALAAHYDGNPLVRAVSVSSCATLTGEPFVMNLTKPAVETMQAAGWTPQAQQRCLQGAVDDYAGWVRTPITFAFNPYRTVVNGEARPDPSVTIDVMEACARSRAHGGPECVLGNNALSDLAATGRSAAVYAEIDTLWQATPAHVGVTFQTVGAAVDCAGIELAVDHHATSVEVWPPNHHYQGFTAVPAGVLRQWDDALRHTTGLSCSS